VRDWCARFRVRSVHYDPYQMAAVAQRLSAAGIPMREYPQSVSHLVAMGSNLYELIKGRGIIAYANEEIRLAVSRTIALETPRGWRLAKEKTSHKIDVVVAFAMASLAAVEQGQMNVRLVTPTIVIGGVEHNPAENRYHSGGAFRFDHPGWLS
jgi:phage terminase large subunit-like protein